MYFADFSLPLSQYTIAYAAWIPVAVMSTESAWVIGGFVFHGSSKVLLFRLIPKYSCVARLSLNDSIPNEQSN